MFGWLKTKKENPKKFDDDLMRHVNKGLMNNALNDFSQCRRFLDSGTAHEADGNYDEAYICYETALKLRNNPMSLYSMAGIHMRRGENYKAKEFLEKARSLSCPADLSLLIEKRLEELKK